VPAIYLNDWPDRYIHTNADEVSHIDATKLLRAAFIGSASAYYLAGLDAAGLPDLWETIRRHTLERTATALARRDRLRTAGQSAAGDDLLRFQFAYEEGVVASLASFADVPPAVRQSASAFQAGLRKLVGEGAAASPPRPKGR
jgi:hypothetical protein